MRCLAHNSCGSIQFPVFAALSRSELSPASLPSLFSSTVLPRRRIPLSSAIRPCTTPKLLVAKWSTRVACCTLPPTHPSTMSGPADKFQELYHPRKW